MVKLLLIGSLWIWWKLLIWKLEHKFVIQNYLVFVFEREGLEWTLENSPMRICFYFSCLTTKYLPWYSAGKTLAFGLPALVHVLKKKKKTTKPGCPTCLVLSPTRELAQQVCVPIQPSAHRIYLKTLKILSNQLSLYL